VNRSLIRRTLCVLSLLAAVALPASAQPDRGAGRKSLERLASVFWQRLSAPVLSLLEKGGSELDPNGRTAPAPESTTFPDETDGRGHIDPDG
jgi:hypothetical protein